jgi:hypothetical protein
VAIAPSRLPAKRACVQHFLCATFGLLSNLQKRKGKKEKIQSGKKKKEQKEKN